MMEAEEEDCIESEGRGGGCGGDFEIIMIMAVTVVYMQNAHFQRYVERKEETIRQLLTVALLVERKENGGGNGSGNGGE